jgi:hypothetical protein
MTNNTRLAQHEHSYTEQPISLTRMKASNKSKIVFSFDALRSNGYPKIFLDEVEKRRARKTEFVPSPEELVRICFLKMSNQRTTPATQSSPTLTAQRNL